MPPQFKELLKHKLVASAFIVVGVILVASVLYYIVATALPPAAYVPVTEGAISEDISSTGVVEPLQNPTLSFVAGGKVALVRATVGEAVGAGTLLASLDTGILSANVAAAKARLAGTQSTLTNAYATLPDALIGAEGNAEAAVYTDTGPLFGTYVATGRAPNFSFDDPSGRDRLSAERVAVENLIRDWQADDASMKAAGNAQLSSMLEVDLARLATLRTYLRDLAVALANADTGSFSNGLTLSAARADVDAATAAVTSATTALTSTQQSLANDSSSPSSMNAANVAANQAAVDAAVAALLQAEIIAPFSGTVASVEVKPGDIAAPNSPALTLIPNGTFEVNVYVTELDVAEVKVGNAADITLDAYGAGRIFVATVSTVETSPTTPPEGGAPAYKVTLVFQNADPAIENGMHANATIHAGSKSSTLLVPRSALIESGSATYVLKKTADGSVKTPVTVGLVSADSAEIISGLSKGDTVAVVGGND